MKKKSLNPRPVGLRAISLPLCHNFFTLTSSTWGFSSMCLPFCAKKFWVRTSKMSAQKTQFSFTSPFSRFVNRTMGMSWKEKELNGPSLEFLPPGFAYLRLLSSLGTAKPRIFFLSIFKSFSKCAFSRNISEKYLGQQESNQGPLGHVLTECPSRLGPALMDII